MIEAPPANDPAALTQYIETRFHARHREQLPELVELAVRVESVHAQAPEVPAGLSALLHRMYGELEVHMKKEELILFPAMRQGAGPGIQHPISVMRSDHDDHSAEIAELRRLTSDLRLPADACRTWTALYEKLRIFIDDLEAHIRLENDVLFPRFETGASGET